MHEFLGLEYQIEFSPEVEGYVTIDKDEKNVSVVDVFFSQPEEIYLSSDSMPKQPLVTFQPKRKDIKTVLCGDKLPIIYGWANNEEYYSDSCDMGKITIGIDIFGSAFFMLTRYEEIVNKNRDEYDRFPARESLAFKEGFIERPIINEYVEILWLAIHTLWPNVKRKQRHFNILPTHDVDRPFGTAFLTTYQKIHTLAGDLIKRKNPGLFFRRSKMIFDIFSKGYIYDEDNTFDLIMDISKKNGLTSTFFFMTAVGISDNDGNYDINRVEITDLIKKIKKRGHRIGVHPSFESYTSSEVMEDSVNRLKSCLADLSIDDAIGGRQHYLRWKNPDTWRHYEHSGLKYDTTLSYADHIGFRCGTCYEYSVFDIEERKMLKLKEYPLIVMECSGLDECYMGLSHEEMCERSIKLKKRCEKYAGNFVILWHNSRFIEKAEIDTYKTIIQG
ncbi:polysaccharide deacetylase family protein [Anaerovibrio lipolyticus]|uniref:polysaccharide deacetylase family protein n=1 Tax=Anaerovibrio lipolyticus TaxID=82374 RepID=UPI0013563055|nr:polysaccharide deacetylase family protein [Anaerovibrio lipolyticus]